MIILCGTCNEEIPVDHACLHKDKDGNHKSYHFGCGIPKPKLIQSDDLNILNSIEVVESDGDGECLYYVHVENTEENRNKLIQIGATEAEIFDMTNLEESLIDISQIGFSTTNAQWFEEGLGGFLDYTPVHAPDCCKQVLPKAIEPNEQPNEVAAEGR